MSNQQEYWLRTMAQYGFSATVLSAVLYFVAYRMVIPMQDVHTRLVDSVQVTNEKNAQTNAANAETNRINADTQRQQTTILEQIRADVSRNAWNGGGPKTVQAN